MKIKKIIITAWLLEVPGYSIWIEAQKWIKIFKNLGYEIELLHGRDSRYPFLGRENKKLLDLQDGLFKKKISYKDFINNNIVRDTYEKTMGLFEKKWQQEKFILVAENSFGPALNIPYSKGLFDAIKQYKIPTIARIHDFYVNFYTQYDTRIKDSIPELRNIYEARSKSISKVFINKSDLVQAKKRKIRECYLIPNGFDFSENISINHLYINQIKSKIKYQPSDLLFLQPTRIITRKRIEDIIFIIYNLSNLIKRPIKLLIAGGFKEYNPETINYQKMIFAKAKKHHVPVFILRDLKVKFNIAEAYYLSDMVTLLSTEEGFGLPVLESCVYKKMLIVRRFPRFSVFENLEGGSLNFIKTKNFNHPWQWPKKELDLFCQQIVQWINSKSKNRILDNNYKITKKNFSIELTKEKLAEILRKIN